MASDRPAVTGVFEMAEMNLLIDIVRNSSHIPPSTLSDRPTLCLRLHNFTLTTKDGNNYVPRPMFPLTFQNLCVHKISLVQNFTRTHLYLEWRVRNMCKSLVGSNIYVHSKFSCVRSSQGLCARAHAHSLKGTLVLSHTGVDLLKILERNSFLMCLAGLGNCAISKLLGTMSECK